jgi:hypothetical protein
VTTSDTLAVAHLRASRRRRAAAIRRWLIALAVAIFLAVWTVIFVQLVSGHDPALARATSSNSSSPGAGSASSGTSSASSGTSSASSGTSGDSSGISSVNTSGARSSSSSAVTTSQS